MASSNTIDIQLGGVLAGVTITTSNAVTGVVALGTDVTRLLGSQNTFVGTEAGQLAVSVNQGVFLGFHAGTYGLGDASVVIGAASAPQAAAAPGTGNSVVIGDSVVPDSVSVDRSVVVGHRAGVGCATMKRAILLGDAVQLASDSCDEVVGIGSRVIVRSPAERVTVVGHFNTAGGTNTTCVGYNNEILADTTDNVALGTLLYLRGSGNVVLGHNVQADPGAHGNLLIGGAAAGSPVPLTLGAVTNVTSFDGGAYPGGLTASDTLYLGGCLRWGKLSGELTLRAAGPVSLQAGGAVSLLAGTAVSLQAGGAVSLQAGGAVALQAGSTVALQATPTLLSAFGVTIAPGGVLTAARLSAPSFDATAVAVGTFTADGLVQARAGATVTGAVLAANAGLTCTTATASGLIKANLGLEVAGAALLAKAGVTVTGAALAANAGLTCTTLAATALAEARLGLTVTGAPLAANAGLTCTTLSASALAEARLGLTVTGAPLAANAGLTCTTLVATALTEARLGLTVTGALLAANAGLTCTTLVATALTEARLGLTVTGAVLAANAGLTCTTLTASGFAKANAGLEVSGAVLTAKQGITVTGAPLAADAGLTCTTLAATALVEAKLGLTVTGAVLAANAGLTCTTLTASGLLKANAGLEVAGALAAKGALTVDGATTTTGKLTAAGGITSTGLFEAKGGFTADGVLTADRFVATGIAAGAEYGVKTTTLRATGTSTLAQVDVAALTAAGLVKANAGLDVAGALLDCKAGLKTTTLRATDMLTADGGLTATAPVALQTTAQITGLLKADGGLTAGQTAAVADLTASGAATLQALTVRGVADLQAGLTVSAGATTVQALTAKDGATMEKTLAVTGLLSANGGLATQVATADRFVANVSIQTPTLYAGDAKADRLQVLDPSPNFSLASGTKSGTAAVRAPSADVDQLYAGALLAASVDAGEGLVATKGTVAAGKLNVSRPGGASWDVTAGTSTAPATLTFKSSAVTVELSDYAGTDRPGRAYCVPSAAGLVPGALVSATGAFSSFPGGSTTPTLDAAVPVVELTTFAAKERCVGVVAAVEASSTERAIPFGALVFRTPRLPADTRVVVNTSGFGAVLVAAGATPVAIGDLLCVSSSVPGRAERQGDDVVRSWTVAKATQAASTAGGDALVACRYV